MATGEPSIRRKFILFDPVDNHNKIWMVEWWPTGEAKTTWGREGVTQQSKSFTGWTTGMVEGKMYEKERKGYREIELFTPPVISSVPSTVSDSISDPKVQTLLSHIFREAGESIKGFLATSIDALSQGQINKGRQIIRDLSITTNLAMQAELVKTFFNTIPTQLPMKYDWDYEVRRFLRDLHEQEDRLDQLSAGLSAHHISVEGDNSQLAQLGGVNLRTMQTSEQAYADIYDYIKRTSGGYERVQQLYEVSIPQERAVYEAETKGTHHIQNMFHGTKAANVRHILRTGLIIPKVAANGSRFGRGIYFADMYKRSYNYCSSYYGPKMIFIVDVKLGTMKELPGDNQSLSEAPNGYDSVRGIKSYSGMDEFIIYRPSQQTIRAIALVE